MRCPTYFWKLFDGYQHLLSELHVFVDDNVDKFLVLFSIIFLNFVDFWKIGERQGKGEIVNHTQKTNNNNNKQKIKQPQKGDHEDKKMSVTP